MVLRGRLRGRVGRRRTSSRWGPLRWSPSMFLQSCVTERDGPGEQRSVRAPAPEPRRRDLPQPLGPFGRRHPPRAARRAPGRLAGDRTRPLRAADRNPGSRRQPPASGNRAAARGPESRTHGRRRTADRESTAGAGGGSSVGRSDDRRGRADRDSTAAARGGSSAGRSYGGRDAADRESSAAARGGSSAGRCPWRAVPGAAVRRRLHGGRDAADRESGAGARGSSAGRSYGARARGGRPPTAPMRSGCCRPRVGAGARGSSAGGSYGGGMLLTVGRAPAPGAGRRGRLLRATGCS